MIQLNSQQPKAGRNASVFCKRNSGFTLVELLVAIAIIGILSTMLLGVASRAGDTARRARTKQLIGRLHTLVTERYESYLNHRVETPVDPNLDLVASRSIGQVKAAQSLHVLRTMMQMDMPDRWSDILCGPIESYLPDDVKNTPSILPNYRMPWVAGSQTDQWNQSGNGTAIPRTDLCKLYIRTYYSLRMPPAASDDAEWAELLRLNQGAECLYLVVMNATGDGEARGLFNETDIGDTDGDGALEFLDGWGQPITYIRWPKGFTNESDLMSTDSIGDHDPFDRYRVHDDNTTASTNSATRLVPLIASAGSDEELGLILDYEGIQNEFVYPLVELNFLGIRQRVVDPYAAVTNSPIELKMADAYDTDQYGRPNSNPAVPSEAHTDNITNHNIKAN